MFNSVRLLTLVASVGMAGGAAAQETGDAAAGEKIFRKCMACHTIEDGAANRVGPNLHNVVGRVAGSVAGFAYSDAVVTAGTNGLIWTPEELSTFLEDPKTHLPGIKMTFAGLKKAQDRADVVAYLLTQSPAAP